MSKEGGLDARALRALGEWFERQKRVLPWRDEPTLYRVWISEIMLQQTQVATVVPYFERFVARFPTVEALAAAPVDDVLLNWAGLGYYSRARNLHRGAQRIVTEGWPQDRPGWLAVPGVGEYTAGAILSIALDRPEAILDGNVERVLARVGRVGREEGDAAYKRALWSRAEAAVRDAYAEGVRPRTLNQALMELGATVCVPRNPRCPACPVREACGAFARGETGAYPPRKKPKEWIAVREEVHACWDGERLRLERRPAGSWRAGLWDLPAEGPGEGWCELGAVESKYVVTRHKVSRRTRVWAPAGGRGARRPLRAAEPAGTTESRWIPFPAEPAEAGVAIGAPLRKSWNAILAVLPSLSVAL